MSVEELFSQIEVEQMMYAYDDMKEELQYSREYLFSFISPLSDEEFFWTMQTGSPSIANHFGYLVYLEKEIGKKLDVNFSFRLDQYDDYFAGLLPKENLELPKRTEILAYYDEVHTAFMSEMRYLKRPEVLFALVNHDYNQIKYIHKICQALGRPVGMEAPHSSRVKTKSSTIVDTQFYLPAYTN